MRDEPRKSTTTDSLFGMFLTQAFMGIAAGPLAMQVLQAAEIGSMAYEDRYAKPGRQYSRTLSP